RVGLERECVTRDVVGLQLHQPGERAPNRLKRLAGQAVHEVDAQVRDARLADCARRPNGLVGRVTTAEETQLLVIEALHAEADSGHSRVEIRFDLVRDHVTRVRLYGYLVRLGHSEPSSPGADQPTEPSGSQQARRA